MPRFDLTVLYKILITFASLFISMLLRKMSRKDSKSDLLFEKDDYFVGLSIMLTATLIVFNYIIDLSSRIERCLNEINQCRNLPLIDGKLESLISTLKEIVGYQSIIIKIFFFVYVLALLYITYHIRKKGWKIIKKTTEPDNLHGLWLPNILGLILLFVALILSGSQYGN